MVDLLTSRPLFPSDPATQALTPTATSFNYGGYTAPFDMAIFVLLVGGLIALLQWDENYGENENAEGPCRYGVTV